MVRRVNKRESHVQKSPYGNETHSPNEKYNSKMNRYLNHPKNEQDVTIFQSKWNYRNPIDSRLLSYTSTLRVTPPPSITHSVSPKQKHCPNLLHTDMP